MQNIDFEKTTFLKWGTDYLTNTGRSALTIQHFIQIKKLKDQNRSTNCCQES